MCIRGGGNVNLSDILVSTFIYVVFIYTMLLYLIEMKALSHFKIGVVYKQRGHNFGQF